MSFHIIFESIINYWYIILLFFTVAILYSSVGFGGGSSYLAILALSGIFFQQTRATSLLCNIVVVFGNILLITDIKKLNWKKIIPLLLFSIPFAFLGGKLKISQNFFFILLGFTLFFAAVSMWISKNIISSKNENSKFSSMKNISYGSVIGFISGMVGIGGGIFLAPLLYLTNWDTPKKIAATASLFILANSIAGFTGQYYNPDFYIDWNLTSILLVAVFIGGQIGSRISNNYFTPVQLKRATSILILFISFRILWKYLF